MTYGDGLSDIDINQLKSFHEKQGTFATLTAVRNQSSFGNLKFKNDGIVSSFKEKPKLNDSWINGGYFILEQNIFEYLNLENIDQIQWENDPLQNIASDNQLSAFKHEGFWKAMDKLSDKINLEKVWSSNEIPWKR